MRRLAALAVAAVRVPPLLPLAAQQAQAVDPGKPLQGFTAADSATERQWLLESAWEAGRHALSRAEQVLHWSSLELHRPGTRRQIAGGSRD